MEAEYYQLNGVVIQLALQCRIVDCCSKVLSYYLEIARKHTHYMYCVFYINSQSTNHPFSITIHGFPYK